MSIVEDARRQVEARRRETENRGSFLTQEELAVRQVDVDVEPAGGTEAPAAELAREAAGANPAGAKPLRGQDFAAFFSSDVRPRKVEFTIGGKPAAVWVKKLDPTDYNTLLSYFSDIAEGMDVSRRKVPISRSLVKAELWRRSEADPEVWKECGLPEDRAERIEYLERQVECSPDVWQPLVAECLEEQGLGAGPGNSTPR
jgi:hypothetical protein